VFCAEWAVKQLSTQYWLLFLQRYGAEQFR